MSLDRPIVAVYGGTFDPFHLGHQAICNAILARPNVDQLRLVPCFLPALKADASASAVQRLEMLSHWRDQHPKCNKIVVDAIEIERQGPSFTVETIAELKLHWPQGRLLFALGADAWNSLPYWHQADKLTAQVAFWVFARDGESGIAQHENIKHYCNFEQFVMSNDAGYWLDSSVQMSISSSDIRSNSNLANQWLPDSVSSYIKKVGLYYHKPSKSQEGNE